MSTEVFDKIEEQITIITEAAEKLDELIYDLDNLQDYLEDLSRDVAQILDESQTDGRVYLSDGGEVKLGEDDFSLGFRTALLHVANLLKENYELGDLDVSNVQSIQDFIAEHE